VLPESANTEGPAKVKTIVAALIWVFLVGPIILNVRLLYFSATRTTRWAMVLVLLSNAWLIAGTAFPPLVGPNYSHLRYAIICANMLVVVVVALLMGRKVTNSALAVGACLWVGLGWLYALIVSSSIA
jgi:hypothetical protein